MSGVLVGEVIAAAEVLKANKLPRSAFHALIAIAEKCHEDTRQGSVPWIHIRRGLYSDDKYEKISSQRTAERAVRALKDAGLLRVVKKGFNNNAGQSAAAIYNIPPLTDTDSQVSESDAIETDTQVSESTQTDTDTNGGRDRHSGVGLNGSNNGTTEGGLPIGCGPYGPRCPRHLNHPHPPPCMHCKQIREKAEAEQHAQQEQALAQRKAAARARADCVWCDENGWKLQPDGPNIIEPTVRCDRHATAPEGVRT